MSFMPLAQWQVHDLAGRRKYLNGAERLRFLAAADDLASDRRALCYVLAYTGCRISEALGMRLHQLDAANCALTLATLKRRRPVFRVVPIPPRVRDMISALPRREDGKVWTMHRATAWRFIVELMERAEIEGPMACCRGLRHGFGIRAAGSYVPPNLIQRWMGHASASTTAIYLDAVGTEEREFAERMWHDR